MIGIQPVNLPPTTSRPAWWSTDAPSAASSGGGDSVSISAQARRLFLQSQQVGGSTVGQSVGARAARSPYAATANYFASTLAGSGGIGGVPAAVFGLSLTTSAMGDERPGQEVAVAVAMASGYRHTRSLVRSTLNVVVAPSAEEAEEIEPSADDGSSATAEQAAELAGDDDPGTQASSGSGVQRLESRPLPAPAASGSAPAPEPAAAAGAAANAYRAATAEAAPTLDIRV